MTISFKKTLLFITLLLVFPLVSFAQVYINEIMYEPEGTDTDNGGEWIEIKVNSEVSDFSDWKIADKTETTGIFNNKSISHVSGPERLLAGSCVVIAKNSEAFASFFSSYTGSLFKSSFSLSPEDEIKLLNSNLTEVDRVAYSSDQGADGDGNSLQKTASGWTASAPTPGADGGSPCVPSEDSGEVLSENTEVSATSGAVSPTYATVSSQLEVSAGGDRITSPGSPISFQALIIKNSVSNEALDFYWSFGDGNVGQGALVSHIYKYPGIYAVVLNAKAGNTLAISRLKVTVMDPSISVSEAEGYIEIANNSNSEINLFNWKIVNKNKGFIFQPDTIVLPKSKIKIDKSLFTIKGETEKGISLRNFLGQEVFNASPAEEIDLMQTAKKLEDIKNEIFAIQEKTKNITLDNQSNIAGIQLKTNSIPVKANEPSRPAPETSETNLSLILATTETKVDPATTSGDIIYEVPKKEGLVSKLTNFIKRVFSK